MDACPSWDAWSAWQDGEAGGGAAGHDAHLAVCPACRDTVVRLERLRTLLGGASAAPDPAASDPGAESSAGRSGCPDPARLSAMASGGLADAERDGVEAHLADCDPCRHEVLVGWDAARAASARTPSRFARWGLAVAAAVAVAAAIPLLTPGAGSDELSRRGFLESGESGVPESVTLHGGIRLDLDPGTRVVDAPGGTGRTLVLERGRVTLRVPPGTGGVTVRTAAVEAAVLGTAFDVVVVRLSGGETASSVGVSEGVVRVRSGSEEVRLEAGWHAYAVEGDPLLVQEGRAIGDPSEAGPILEQYRRAVASGRDRDARWLAAILLTSGQVTLADLADGAAE